MKMQEFSVKASRAPVTLVRATQPGTSKGLLPWKSVTIIFICKIFVLKYFRQPFFPTEVTGFFLKSLNEGNKTKIH